MKFSPATKPLFAPIFAVLLLGSSLIAQDKDWRPVTPEERAAKTPTVEPTADAEASFWEVRIDDSSTDEMSMKHYVRVKIYTERGREKYSKFDIPFVKGMKIKDLAARVVKADGSIVDIKKDDIFEREIVRANGLKVKAKSFAVPNIEPGVIVEYRYKEVIDGSAKGMRLHFQRDIPVQNLSYYYKPYDKRDPVYQTYNFKGTKFVKDKDGYWLASRTAVPALREEDRMPPEDMVRPWMLLTGANIGITSASAFSFSYTIKDPSNPQAYWAAVGAEHAFLPKLMLKSSKDVKTAAVTITSGAATADEKLRKLYEFVQTDIENSTFNSTLTEEQRKKLPKIESIGDVLKKKVASSQYIDMTFGALAAAIGMDARIGLASNRSQMFFTPAMANEHLLHLGVIAVKVDDKWKFFNPGMKFLPYGSLVWYEEDTWTLLLGEKDMAWVKTPLTSYDRSFHHRDAKLTLSEDGSLEGTVTEVLSGHPAISYRAENYDETPAKREDGVKQDVVRRMSTAEVSDVTVENTEDASKPLTFRYKVRVPNYAQKTGKRLFIQPGFFEYGVSPIFSSADRKYDIFFRYPWAEKDTIEITYPKSYDLDNAEAPENANEPNGIGALNFKVVADKGNNTLKYERNFMFGGGGHVLFPASSYTAVKQLFDVFNKSDAHTITLRQK